MANWLTDVESDAVLTAREPQLGTYSKPFAIHCSHGWIWVKLISYHEVLRIVSPMIYALSSTTPVAEQGEIRFIDPSLLEKIRTDQLLLVVIQTVAAHLMRLLTIQPLDLHMVVRRRTQQIPW